MAVNTGLIDKTVLIAIADRLAWQSKQIVDAVEIVLDDNGGAGTSYASTVTSTDNVDVEIPLLSNYYAADSSISVNGVLKQMSGMKNIISTMDSHFSRVSHTGSWDNYCEQEDVKVSNYFNEVYKAAKNTPMLANHVFAEKQISFGSVNISGVSTIDFTDGYNFGDGSATNKAGEEDTGTSTIYYAPTELQVYIPESGGSVAAGTYITVTGKDQNNNMQTLTDYALTASSVGGWTEALSGTWLDVTDVTLGGSSTAATGDFEIVNIADRVTMP